MCAMLHLYKAAARFNGGREHLIHPSFCKTKGGHHDIHDRVDGADLVKGDAPDVDAVSISLGLGEHAKDPARKLFDGLVEAGAVDQPFDIGVMGVPVPFMIVTEQNIGVLMGVIMAALMIVIAVVMSVFMAV